MNATARRDHDHDESDRLWRNLRRSVRTCPPEWRELFLNALCVIAEHGHTYVRATGKIAALHTRELRAEFWPHIERCNDQYNAYIAPDCHGWDRPRGAS